MYFMFSLVDELFSEIAHCHIGRQNPSVYLYDNVQFLKKNSINKVCKKIKPSLLNGSQDELHLQCD